MPPFTVNTPSPALSILKTYLCKYGYSIKVIYWNILLHNLENEFVWNKQNTRKTLQDTTILYAAYLAVKTKNKSLYDEVKAVLRTILPIMLNEVNFYDEHIKKYTIKLEQFIDKYLDNIDFNNILYFGFSMKMDQWVLASVIAKKIKKRNTNIPIVIGGINTDKVAKAFLDNFKQFDIAIWGEGEIPLLALTRFFLGTNNYSNFGIDRSYFREKNIVKNSFTIKHDYIDLSENEIYPNFADFFEYKKPSDFAMLYIEGGRGCHWNKCHFCYLNEGYRYRQKSIEKISQEIKYLISTYNIFHFAFTDNDIIGKDINRLHSFLSALFEIKKEYPDFIVTGVQIMPLDLSGKIIKKMWKAGITSIQIGFECASNSLLKKIDKKNTFATNLNTIKHCNDIGIKIVGVYIIYSFPEEKEEDIYESMENLRFLRFIMDKNPPNHVPLAINSSSKYFNAILDRKQEYSPRLNAYKKVFFDTFDEEAQWHFFEFILKNRDEKWDYLVDAQTHYMSNKYEYQFIIEKDLIIYQEHFNNELIEHIEFDNDDLYISILDYCYDKPISINELSALLSKNNMTLCEIDVLKEKIDFLFNQGLVYRTPDYNEIVSIVTTKKMNYDTV